MVHPESTLQDTEQSVNRPWFTIFNQYYGPEQTATYFFKPFPSEEFPPHSPWEDCVIIAHFGIEEYASAAGFSSVNLYLKHLIREAATRIT